MKLVISTIVTAILFFLLGWLFYGVIFTGHLSSMQHLMRPDADLKMWSIALGCLFQGLMLSVIYMRTYKGESPIKEGFIFGILTGFLLALPYVFYVWGSYQVRYRAVIADGVGMGIRILIVCIVIGLIFGKKKTAA